MWRVADPGQEAIRALEQTLSGVVADAGAKRVLAQVLAARGVAAEQAELFLKAPLACLLRPPALMCDLDRAAERLADAVTKGERVVVYGDYDVDGIAGTAELVLFLRALGVEAVTHIPDRIEDGYGLNERVLRALASNAPAVLVTVDCGSTAHEEVALASRLGFDVIICDHHQLGEGRPPAYAFLNPHQEGCKFPFKGLSAAGVVFYLLAGLRRVFRERGIDNLPDLRRQLDLVAMAAIGDVVPLVEENRALVRYGLAQIRKRTNRGIAALLDVSRVETVDSEAVAFQLAPRINAAGRIGDPRLSLELLTTDSLERARDLALMLERDNQRRRTIETQMVGEAIAACEELPGWPARRSIVVWSEQWHPGVGGIVAARLAEKYGLPAIVVSVENGIGRGSGRSVDGIALDQALRYCGGLCEKAGGHGGAVGLTIRAERLDEFAQAFEESIKRLAPKEGQGDALLAEAEVRAELLKWATVEALSLLEPCGEGNPPPLLLTRGLRVIERRVVGERHLLLRLLAKGVKGATFEAIGFRMNSVTTRAGDLIDCLYRPRIDRWRGSSRVRMQLVAVRPNV